MKYGTKEGLRIKRKKEINKQTNNKLRIESNGRKYLKNEAYGLQVWMKKEQKAMTQIKKKLGVRSWKTKRQKKKNKERKKKERKKERRKERKEIIEGWKEVIRELKEE